MFPVARAPLTTLLCKEPPPKGKPGCEAVIKISNADATVRYETPCGRVKIVQETNKSENK